MARLTNPWSWEELRMPRPPWPHRREGAFPETYTADPGNPILFPKDVKPVEVGVGPPQNDLEHMVQIGDNTVTVDETAPPNHGVDAQQDHFALIESQVGGA
jgi:hypothetical protein